MLTARDFFFGDGAADEADEAAFFNSLKMRNGTFKTTRRDRFDDLAPRLVEALRARLGPSFEILDVGASSGASSVQLLEALLAAGAAPRVTATDLFVEARLVEVMPGLRALIDEKGWPLQYEILGLPARPWIRRLDYVTLAAAPRAALRRLLAPRLARLARERAGRRATLVTRRFETSPNMTLIRDDILIRRQEFERRFDFVRAANILHRDYFTEEQLARAVGNVAAYLKGPGSLFLACRTSTRTAENAATLFEMGRDGRLLALEHFGAATEIEPIVLAHRGRVAAAAASA